MRTLTKGIADHVRRARDHLVDDEPAAFRVFLNASDDLARQGDDQIVECTLSAPPLTGTHYDAAFAALVEYHLSSRALPIPEWVNEPRRFTREWFVDDSSYGRAHDHEQTPEPFLRRGVIIAETELASV